MPPRYAPEIAFPAFAFVSGRVRRHTEEVAISVTAPTAAEWRSHAGHRHGIDLFNHGYYWEAHEEWEAIWRAAGKKGATADLFKGLIKLAAAGVKYREGRAAGVASHAAKAVAIFTRLAEQQGSAEVGYLGLCLGDLLAFARQTAALAPVATADTTELPRIVFPFTLQLAQEPNI